MKKIQFRKTTLAILDYLYQYPGFKKWSDTLSESQEQEIENNITSIIKTRSMNTSKYKIKIVYETGDSYTTEICTEYLELTWHNLDNAKANLLAIKEHYEMYQNSLNHTNFENYKNRWWFVNSPKPYSIKTNQAINESAIKKLGKENCEYRPDPYLAIHCLKLKADTGNLMQLTAFWCGHFERLYEIEIVLDSDMKFVF